MSTRGLAHSGDNDWPYRGDARAWELLAEVVDGKLSVQSLCERQRMRLEDVQGWLRERHRSALMAFDEQLRSALIRQGAAPESLVGPELGMSLSDVSIIDWIQAIQIFAKHAVITVLHESGESRLWCSQGAIIDAISGRLSGEAAVFRIAALEQGQVVTELRAVNRERTIRSATPWLLLEGARRKDEGAQLRLQLGDLDRHFRCSDGSVLNRSLNTAEAAVLRAFDEPRRLLDVLDQSDLGDVETLMVLARLVRSGHLEQAPRTEPPRRGVMRTRRLERGGASAVRQLPISFVWPRERAAHSAAWRWLAGASILGVLVSSAAWLGARTAVARVANRPEPALVAVPRAAQAPSTYPVRVRTYPLDAALQIDGRDVGNGSWSTRLPVDGVIHELRVSAPGFVPARVIFIDAAPPGDVRLEPLLERAPAAAAEVTTTASSNTASSNTARASASSAHAEEVAKGGRTDMAVPPKQRRRKVARTLDAKSIEAAAGDPPSTNEKPYVRVIESGDALPALR